MTYYVYAYYVPGEPLPFYIGKGKDRRAYWHLGKVVRNSRKCHFYSKLNNLLARGIRPLIVFLYKNLTEQDAFKYERATIALLGRQDVRTGCLCNHSDGGEGSSGAIHPERSIEYRIRQSRSRSKEAVQNIRKAGKRRGFAVEAIHPTTGRVQERFSSLKEAARAGFCRKGILRVCNGIQPSSSGLLWRFAA